MTKRPWSSVTTILAYLVGSSVVSAMTQIPASGPLGPVTTPPMSSLSISTAACCAPAGAGTATAIAAMPMAATVQYRACRKVIDVLPDAALRLYSLADQGSAEGGSLGIFDHR